ncbi:hypothetical protein [Paenibacillus sp. GCM10027626]|uniref:hypothetical protein n=1 Tax=Paenibacillus sp. GCM10027626 TaxID=3273411 RepID=UPI00363C75BE
MAFCTNCGQRLTEGELHVCGSGTESRNGSGDGNGAEHTVSEEESVHDRPAPGESRYSGVSRSVADSMKQVDGNLILGLLKNPQSGLNLNPQKDLIYGLLGIAASIIGFVIYAWIVGMQIDSMVGGFFGGLGSFGVKPQSLVGGIVGNMLLVAIVSMVAFLGSMWLVGSWRGSRKVSIQAFVTYFGSMHYLSGAGFVVAGLVALMSYKLSLLLIVINLLIMLLLSFVSAMELFGISREQQFSFIAPAVTIYTVVVLIIVSII